MPAALRQKREHAFPTMNVPGSAVTDSGSLALQRVRKQLVVGD
jgi:hypothetical protein